MYFNICFCFFAWYFHKNYKFYKEIEKEIKKIKKKKKKHGKVLLLANPKLNSIEVLTSKALIDSNISHDESALIKNVPEEYGNMKEEIKNLKN